MEKRKIIIALDFDGFIVENKYPNIGELRFEAKKYINKIKDELNAEIIIWTCRGKERLQNAVDFLKENKIPFDYVNDNSDVMKELFKDNADTRKVYADCYCDDHNLFFDDYSWKRIYEGIAEYKLINNNQFI